MTVKACIECGVETSAYMGRSALCNMCIRDRGVLPKSERVAAMKPPAPKRKRKKQVYKKKEHIRPDKVPYVAMKKFLVTVPVEKLEEIQNLAAVEGTPFTLWVRAAIYHYIGYKKCEKERLENFYRQKEQPEND